MTAETMQQHGTDRESGPAKTRSGGVPAGRMWISLLLYLVALACVVVLGNWSGLTLASVRQTLLSIPLWLYAVFALLTVLQIALSAWKWQLVLKRLTPDASGAADFRFCFGFSAVAAFLSQFLTVYVSSIVVRGWAVKREHGMPARHGAVSSLYEQMFDMAALTVMVLPTVLAWSLGASFLQWAALTGLLVLAGGLMPWVLHAMLALFSKLRPSHPVLRKPYEIIGRWKELELLSAPFMIKLYAISIVRYLTLLVRVPLLVAALGMSIALFDSIAAFTIVQATQIAAITPGQLGIREWTWTGVLAFRGYDLQVAAQLAIALRLAGTIAMTVATAPSVYGLLAKRKSA